MKPEVAAQLQAILDDRQKQKQAAIARAAERQSAEAKNHADFSAKKEAIIKPAFREIVNLYQANGITIRVVEEDERPTDRGGIQSPSIKLDMSGAYSSSSTPKPQFTLAFDANHRILSLYTSTGSQVGPAGTVSLDAITVDWIQEAFLKYQSR